MTASLGNPGRSKTCKVGRRRRNELSSEATNAAENLLGKAVGHDLGEIPVPIFPDQIAKALSVRAYEDDLDELDGFILKEPDGVPVIVINREFSDTHRRFALAHELGHYVRTPHASQFEWIDVVNGPMSWTYYSSKSTLSEKDLNEEEIYANAFAASLLVPYDLLKGHMLEGWTSVPELAYFFLVSTPVIRKRLKDTGLDKLSRKTRMS